MQFAQKQLLLFVIDLTNGQGRPRAIKEFSRHFGLESFIIFIPDSEVGTLLPAPEFPQTLPSGKLWRSFLAACLEKKVLLGELPWNGRCHTAQGVASVDGSVAVFLGKPLPSETTAEMALLLPLLAAALNGERAAATCRSQTQLAMQSAAESKDLARRLDEARRAAQREIAARIKAQEEVRRTNETLEKRVEERTRSLSDAVAQLEEFSYTVAHDLRAPLRAITGFGHILLTEYSSDFDPEAKDFLNRIISSSARMDQLTLDLISFTKVTRADFRLSVVNLDQEVEETSRYFSQSFPGAKVVVKSHLGNVMANELLIGQCLNNLLDNAAKYSFPDRPIFLEIWTEDRGNIKRLHLKDNGIGIRAEYQDRIFKIFERVEIEKPGTGVGLAIVKRAVERMGGNIGVVSSPGTGSTFWIDLQKP